MSASLIYYVAATLDGYIARPDGSVDWLQPLEQSGDDHGYGAFYDSIDGLLMGRGTYETVLAMGGAWPYPGKPCTVLTRAELEPAAPQVRIAHNTPAEALAELAEAGCKRVWLVGGGSLAGTCYAAGLIDELIVSVVPHLLGAGIQMFATGLERRLQLHEQRSFATGVVQLHYKLLPEAPNP
ncbi:dihydrofolate reductase family protein [Pseudomonas solani]|uniref:dihydrofolate reductase family protein n=1 Tax=Pseudomonas TaxID=286 RepID=UPI0021DF897A|nr:dihydrofolate reductase family protein [Pseudomonas sp. PDM13]MCU9949935.1 dihydrofolate reductase family protein [Pseudomonas sp. PDM13]